MSKKSKKWIIIIVIVACAISMVAFIVSNVSISSPQEVGEESNYDKTRTDGPESKGTAGSYSIDNILPGVPSGDIISNPVSSVYYADYLADEHAEETGTLDYLDWLSDYCVNVIEPQTVEMLLRIPLFQEAADERLLGKSITFGLTYDDDGGYAAITMPNYLDENGRSIPAGDTDTKVYNIAQKICVNTYEFDADSKNDHEKLKILEDAMLHEMMHAFMTDYTRNGCTGMLKDGSFPADKDGSNGFPLWFIEGTAITVQRGYDFTREDMLEMFLVSPEDSMQERLNMLGSPQTMYESITYVRDAISEEQWDSIVEEGGRRHVLPTDLTNPANQYLSAYYGVMYLYYLSAQNMGLEAFDTSGSMDMNIMMQGMENILKKLHQGYSLNELIAELSMDRSTGIPRYENVEAYEDSFLNGADEPSMVFLQKMLYDFESRISDPNQYIPSGSVIPGYNNYHKAFMDDEHRGVADVYGVVCGNKEPYCDYYAVSSVRPSDAALTGGCRVSYKDAPALTTEEIADRDRLYIGDEVMLVDLQDSDEYTSPADWVRAGSARSSKNIDINYKEYDGYLDEYEANEAGDYIVPVTENIPDVLAYDFVTGCEGTDHSITLGLYSDSSGNIYMLLFKGNNPPVFGHVLMSEETGRAGAGMKLTYSDGDYVLLYQDDDVSDTSLVEDSRGNLYTVVPTKDAENGWVN